MVVLGNEKGGSGKSTAALHIAVALLKAGQRVFRWVDGFAERLIYREFFPRGLTALDDLDKATLGTRPSKSHVAARGEVIALLNLPVDVSTPDGTRPYNCNAQRRCHRPDTACSPASRDCALRRMGALIAPNPLYPRRCTISRKNRSLKLLV